MTMRLECSLCQLLRQPLTPFPPPPGSLGASQPFLCCHLSSFPLFRISGALADLFRVQVLIFTIPKDITTLMDCSLSCSVQVRWSLLGRQELALFLILLACPCTMCESYQMLPYISRVARAGSLSRYPKSECLEAVSTSEKPKHSYGTTEQHAVTVSIVSTCGYFEHP